MPGGWFSCDCRGVFTARRAQDRLTAYYASRAARRRRFDRVLTEIDHEQLQRAGRVAPGELEPWERAKRAPHAQGDNAALERKLAALRERDPAAYVALWPRTGPSAAGGSSAPACNIAPRRCCSNWRGAMPDPIRVPEPLLGQRRGTRRSSG